MATFSLVKKQIFRFFIFKNKIRYLFQFIMQFFQIVLLIYQSKLSCKKR